MIYKLLKYSLSVLLCAVAFQITAQEEYVDLYGSVKDESNKKKIESVQVQIFKDGNIFDTYNTGASGKYAVKLPLGFTYDVKFSKEGYLAKIIRLDTRNIRDEDKGVFDTGVDGTLFPYREGFNTDLLKEPLAVASYDEVLDALAFDVDYGKKKAEMIKAEFKRLDDIEKNFGKLKQEFDELVQQGDKAIVEKQYEKAMNSYKAALAIFPKDEPVKAKYEDAKAKYDAEMAANGAEAAYKKLVADADALFKGDKYGEAKKKYEEAYKKKSSDKYVAEQIYQCELSLADFEKRSEYNGIVAKADKDFQNKDYAVSIEKYKQAATMYPSEPYPKDQILKAEAGAKSLLADAAEKARIQQQYDDKMALGERNFTEDKLEQAIKNFEDAGRIKPEEQLPKDKIAELEKLLADRKSKADQDNALASADAERDRIEREYNDIIQQADALYAKEDWLTSRSKYEQALTIKSDAQYPQSRIEGIDLILSQQKDGLEKLRLRAVEDSIAAAKLASMDEGTRKKLALKQQAQTDFERRMQILEDQRIAENQKLIDAKKKSREWDSNVDTEAEDKVEQYYRDAQEKEYAAQCAVIKQKVDESNSFYKLKEKKSEELLAQREEAIQLKKAELQAINQMGDSRQKLAATENKKKKEQIQNAETASKQLADNRLTETKNDIEKKKEMQQSLAQNDRNRQVRVAETAEKKEFFAKDSEGYQKRGDALRTDNKIEVERKKEEQLNLSYVGEDVRKENENRVMSKRKDEELREADERKAADSRITNSNMRVDAKKQTAQAIGDGKDAQREEKANALEEKKQGIEIQNIERDQKSANDRFDARNKAFEKKAGNPKSEEEYLAVPGTENLPEGVKENSYEEGNKMIIERTVKVGNKVDKYKKVISKNATYYFKNGQSITDVTWETETTGQPE